MPTLTLRGLSKHFGTAPRVDALREVDLEIPQGSYVAIEGESGGGKSTLLNVLGLLDSASSGRYVIDGRDVSGLTDREASERRSDLLAFIFQSFHLLDRRPVVENVELPLHYRGVDPRTMRRRALAALERVGLTDKAWTTPRTLSGGQRQRVAIARALASGAPIVLADEPTGNLDTRNGAEILSAFDELQQDGATLIVVTHSETVAAHASQRVEVVDGVVSAPTPPHPREAASGHAVPTPPGVASTVRGRAAVRDAWRNVTTRPARSIGLVAAVGVSLALAVTTFGLSASAGAQVSSEFDTATNQEVAVTVTGDGATASMPFGARAVAEGLQDLNGVESAVLLEDLGIGSVRVGAPRPVVQTSVLGATGATDDALRADIDWAQGREGHLSPSSALIGENLAKNLGLADVDLLPTIEVNGEYVAVVGVILTSPRAPDLLGKVIIGSPDVDAIPVNPVTAYVVTRTGAAAQVADEAPKVIDPYRPGALEVQEPAEASTLRERVEASVTASLTLLTVVTLVASLASVIIATLVSVGERSAEIGLRRALGARRRHIDGMLILESVLLGALGGVAGALLGALAVLIITVTRQWTPVFDPMLALVAVAGGVGIAVVGAVVGALRANRIVPAEALRS